MCRHTPDWKGNFFSCTKCGKIFVNKAGTNHYDTSKIDSRIIVGGYWWV